MGLAKASNFYGKSAITNVMAMRTNHITQTWKVPANVLEGWNSDDASRADVEPLQFMQEQDIALSEFSRLIDFKRNFEYPSTPELPFFRRGTASGPLQLLRRFIAFNDTRSLLESDTYTRSTGLNSLALATERAIARHQARGVEGGAPVLTIGAGQRVTEQGLKVLYGDAISIHEVSPRFSRTKDAVDVEVSESRIEEAALPASSFELAYSIMGSYYAKDQVDVLQRVVDSLRVGGELFLMWPLGSRNKYNAILVDQWSGVFHEKGLSIGASLLVEESFNPFGEPKIIGIWATKVGADVDVRDAFDEAGKLSREGNRKGDAASQAVFRLTANGSYFGAQMMTNKHLAPLVESMIDMICVSYSTDSKTLLHKMTGIDVDEMSSEVARLKLAESLVKNNRSALKGNYPLTQKILRELSRALAILDTDEIVRDAEAEAKFVREQARMRLAGLGRY